MTEHLCNSLGYSKQAYYKSLRADRGGEERERYVLSIVQDIRRDMPNLGVNKLWNMLGSNGLPVGRDWLYRLLHLHDLMIKQKKYRVITTDSRAMPRPGMASPVPEPGERVSSDPAQPGMGQRHHVPVNECRFRVPLAGNRRLFPADHGLGSSPDTGLVRSREGLVPGVGDAASQL